MLQSTLESQTKSILNSNGYNTVKRLGKGGFGHVLLATKATSSSTCYAVKCISKKKMIKDPQLKRFLLHEINTMALLNHINIVKLLKTFEEGQWFFLVLEYCDMGNLHSFTSKLPHRTLPLDDALVVFKQILRGLQEIHANNIIHRDIKLENILLKKNKGQYICKIGDFGLARPIDHNEAAGTNCGTQIYMAPQILSGRPYGRQADIWAMGVLLYTILLAEFPFKGINILDEIRARCLNGYNLQQVGKIRGLKSKKDELLVVDFFQRIFELQPHKRISVNQILDHGLMREEDGKMTSESPNTTATEEQQESLLEWQCSRIFFIQRIVQKVVSYNFLTFWLTTAFKFYINKALLHFLNRPEVKILKQTFLGSTVEIQINQLEIKIMDQLKVQHSLLLKNQHLKQPTQGFQDGFNTSIQEFSNFKMAYRNTVGRVYEQVHRKLGDNLQDRAALKLKLFLCHIINRVFSGCVNPAIFPYYLAWINKHGIKISTRFYDFASIEEWIDHDRPQTLQRSQDTINKMFYK